MQFNEPEILDADMQVTPEVFDSLLVMICTQRLIRLLGDGERVAVGDAYHHSGEPQKRSHRSDKRRFF